MFFRTLVIWVPFFFSFLFYVCLKRGLSTDFYLHEWSGVEEWSVESLQSINTFLWREFLSPLLFFELESSKHVLHLGNESGIKLINTTHLYVLALTPTETHVSVNTLQFTLL